MSNVDLARLDALFAAANLSELSSHHIVNEGYGHLANLCAAPDKPCFVLQHRKEIMDWFAAMHNEFPALAAELRTLRAQVAELEQCNTSHETANALWYGKLEKALCEVDQMRAERDAAQAEAAGLREALALTNNCGALDDPMWTAWKEANSDALARTPDQHRARIVAVGLRETANRMHPHIDRETLLAEAERLEKEAGNETKAV